MSLGKAAVYKHIPVYYPGHVGAVGGVVGMIGGLGGFLLPISFGVLNDWLGVWTSCFMLLFVLVASALTWMHFAIRRMDRRRFPQMRADTDLPEFTEMINAAQQARTAAANAAAAAAVAAAAAEMVAARSLRARGTS
jgi:NNP family nitrate/nitrite transporter-like MFS transporter